MDLERLLLFLPLFTLFRWLWMDGGVGLYLFPFFFFSFFKEGWRLSAPPPFYFFFPCARSVLRWGGYPFSSGASPPICYLRGKGKVTGGGCPPFFFSLPHNSALCVKQMKNSRFLALSFCFFSFSWRGLAAVSFFSPEAFPFLLGQRLLRGSAVCSTSPFVFLFLRPFSAASNTRLSEPLTVCPSPNLLDTHILYICVNNNKLLLFEWASLSFPLLLFICLGTAFLVGEIKSDRRTCFSCDFMIKIIFRVWG